MVRAKVREKDRQRTSRACDRCKKKKQKCDGGRPCLGCSRKHLHQECTYTIPSSTSDNEPFPETSALIKRRRRNAQKDVDLSANSISLPAWGGARLRSLQDLLREFTNLPPHQGISSLPEPGIQLASKHRMLLDPTGRLIYFGSSSVLCFLQSVRGVINDAVGPSLFTQDPERYEVPQPVPLNYPNGEIPCGLPPAEEAHKLLIACANITAGLLDVIDYQDLHDSVNMWHTSPRLVPLSDQCLIYLALGLGTLASDIDYSSEEGTVYKKAADPSKQAERYYASAEVVSGPVSQFVDGDIRSIQALAMMAVYNLVFPRWNACYCFIGMAAKAAIGMGMHQTHENDLIFSDEDRALRRRIWRSLFALDQMISLMYGRPLSISEGDYHSDITEPTVSKESNSPDRSYSSRTSAQEAVLMLSQTAGEISTRIYNGEDVSLRTMREISEKLMKRANLFSRWVGSTRLQTCTLTPVEVFSIINTHLYAYFIVIVMTRPFFFRHWNMSVKGLDSDPELIKIGMSQLHDAVPSLHLSQACVDASVCTIHFILHTWDSGHLSRRTPSLLLYLFTAILVLLSNQFGDLHNVDDQNAVIESAIDFVQDCTHTDIQGHKVLRVLVSYKQVVDQHLQKGRQDEDQKPSVVRVKEESKILHDSSPDKNAGGPEGFSPIVRGRSESILSLPDIPDISRASTNFDPPPIQLPSIDPPDSSEASPLENGNIMPMPLPAVPSPTLSQAAIDSLPIAQQGLPVQGFWGIDPSYIFPGYMPAQVLLTFPPQSLLTGTDSPVWNHYVEHQEEHEHRSHSNPE